MGRPADWTPLGCSGDPVPGDPAQISREAAHLSTVAKQITDQVAALRKIAGGGVEVGQHAEQIRSSASDLAGQLDKVAGRYQKVSAALSRWVPDLEQAQAQSITALNEAEAPYKKLNTAVILPSGSNLTAQQKQDITNYHSSMNQAQQQLDTAKALLAKAVSFRDQQASHYAGIISNAIDDGVKDSWWDSFTAWVTRNAGWLSKLASVLGDIVAVLAIICLFIPGLDLLIIAAIALTAMLLVIHTMLAATGNGSWFDVALDVIGVATLGIGLGASGGIEGAESVAREAAVTEHTGMASNLLEEYRPALNLFRSFVNEDGGLSSIGRTGVKLTYTAIKDQLPEIPAEAERASGFLAKTVEQFKAASDTWKSLDSASSVFTHGGDPAIAGAMKTIGALSGNFPGVPAIAEQAATAGQTLNLARWAFGIGNAATIGDFGATHFMPHAVGDGYLHFKEQFTYPLSARQVAGLGLAAISPGGYALVSSQW
jgi:hypothetical protein